jgi:uncharacterized metal-binding protein
MAHQPLTRRTALSVAVLLQGTLLRLLAVTQFYHFAFLVVILAPLAFLMRLPFPPGAGLAGAERAAAQSGVLRSNRR